MSRRLTIPILILSVAVLAMANLVWGSVSIPLADTVSILLGK